MLTCMFACLVLASESEMDRPPPVAIIVDVKGKAKRTEGEETHAVRRLDLLRPGDKVSADSAGSVTVLFVADGHLEKLTAGAAITVMAASGTATGRVEQLPATMREANLDAVRSMVRSGKIGGGTFRGDELPRPSVAPLDGTLVTSERPVLRWPATKDATGYQVVLLSGPAGENEKEIRNEETKAAEWRYPNDVPALARNRTYRWRVIAKMRGGSEKTVIKESRFTVGPAEMEKQAAVLSELAKKDDAANLLVAALGFESLRLLDELYPLYSKLAKQAGDDANLWAKAAEYAGRAGQPEEAAAALKKARDLGWKPDAP